MKHIKRMIATLLCFALLLTMAPLTAFAVDERPTDPALIADEDKYTDPDYDFELNCNLEGDQNGIHYRWDAATKTVYADGIEPESTLRRIYFGYFKFYVFSEDEIPSSGRLGRWKNFAFHATYAEHIVIGKNISVIENMNLSNYPALIGISAEDGHPGVEIINSSGFFGEYDNQLPLRGIELGEKAYEGFSVDTLTLPSTVMEIGKECFLNADIRIIDLSQTNITVIPDKCFYGVKNLETVLLPPCVEKIGDRVFMNSDIQYITLPSAVVSIGYCTFTNCTRLESADLSKCINVKSLYETFFGCTALTDVQLPPTLETLDGTFTNCSSLEHLDIPYTVTSISGISGTKLQELEIPNGVRTLAIGDPGLEIIDLSKHINGISLCSGCFENNETVKKVILPTENFGAIPNNCFEGCTNLESVKIYCCDSIGNDAFARTSITQIELPDNCTFIDDRAFSNCHELRTVRMPMDLEVIDNGDPFDGCENLETVIYPSRNMLLYSDAPLGVRNKSYEYRAAFIHRRGFLTNEGITVYLYPDTEIEQYCKDYSINYQYINWDLERNTTVGAEPEEPGKEFTREGTIGNGTFQIWTSKHYTGFHQQEYTMSINANGPLTTTEVTCSNGTQATIAELMKEYNVRYLKFEEGTTAIADNLFKDYVENGVSLSSLYFAPSVKTIGKYAFSNTNVNEVWFCDGVEEVGEYAFAENSYLMYVHFSNSMTEIKEGTFYHAAVLSDEHVGNSVKIPKSVSKIGKKAFGGFCRDNIIRYTEITSGNNLKLLTNRGYSKLTSDFLGAVTTYYIPDVPDLEIYYDPEHPEDNAFGVTDEGILDDWIRFNVWYGTPGYRYVKLFGLPYYSTASGANTETEEEKNAPPVYNISLPTYQEVKGIISNEEMIGNDTDSKMTWIYRPETKTLFIKSNRSNSFNYFDFYYADGTKMQSGDLEVDTLVFQGNFRYVYGKTTYWKKDSNGNYGCYYTLPVSFFNPKHIDFSQTDMLQFFDGAFENCTRLESITIPGTVGNIGIGAFNNTPSLRKVIFEDGIKEIPAGMFRNHKGLQFVELPSTLTSIGANAFNGCTNLQKIEIPDSCVAIGMNAFKSCFNVLSVTLGSGLNQIGKDAFSDLLYCEQITVRTDKIRTDASVIGIDYREIFGNLGTMTGGITVTYADGLGTADFKVFDDKKVTKIVLGADIEALKNADCLTALDKIELSEGNNNYYLENGALYTKKHILALVPRTAEAFTIPETCKGIGENALYGTAISTISVPGKVKTIGAYAFANCKSLKSVTLNKGTEELGEGAFSNCDKLRFIFTPTNLDSIGDNAFKNCNKLSSVILNDELRHIGVSAFAECPVLRGIVIPEHVETIGDRAFADCESLEYAYIWNAQLLGEDVFLNDPLVRVYTVLGSDTYAWAREYNIPYVSYLDEDAFYTETMLKMDVEAGYLGYCEGEHGDIEWLTVCDADCENDGYIIGVCEYCSELLAEVHVPAIGHSYTLVTHIPSTATQNAADIYRCDNCGDVYTVYDTEEPGENTEVTQTVTGKVVFANSTDADSGEYAARGVAVQLEGVTLARTDNNGDFSLELPEGTYSLTLHYTCGFDREMTVTVGEEAVDCGSIPLIGCDFNRDGVLNDEDVKLMRILMSAHEGDDSYLAYVDMNHDGIINATDFAILKACLGADTKTYQYPAYVVE